MDHTIVWISLAVAVVAVFGYVVVMRVFFRDSKELDKKIDYAKMKKWTEDD